MTASAPGPAGTGPVVAGLDIGGSKVLAVVVDEHDRVLASRRLATPAGAHGIVDSSAEVLADVAADAGLHVADLAAVGVGIPGLVDPRLGVVAHAVNLGLDANGIALAAALETRLGLPVVVENDVNAAAVGAAQLLDAGGRDLAYLSIGTGLAAGLVLDGRLRRGHAGAAGEIGHVPVDRDGSRCGCGQIGCLETVASGSALARAWPVTAGASSAQALFDAAAAGDPAAVTVRDAFAEHLAMAVTLLVLTVDVDLVVLGGGVAEVGTPLEQVTVSALARAAGGSSFLRALDLPSRVVVAPAEQSVAAVGAALLGRAEAMARRPAGSPA